MPTEAEKMQFVRKKTIQRFLFSLISLTLYFSFAFNWTAAGSTLRERIGESHITGSLVMFVLLILGFIVLELLFIWLSHRQEN